MGTMGWLVIHSCLAAAVYIVFLRRYLDTEWHNRVVIHSYNSTLVFSFSTMYSLAFSVFHNISDVGNPWVNHLRVGGIKCPYRSGDSDFERNIFRDLRNYKDFGYQL